MSSETAANGRKSESGMTGITDPRDTDVLCGRGGAALRHPGNQTYRRLVNLNKGLYITCLKTEKLKISRSIVAAIREQNGRFLEKDAAKGNWYDIGDKKAIEKTSQALREGQPKLRQKIVEMGGGAAGTAALMEQQFGANGIYAQNATANVVHQQQQMQQQQQQQQMRGGGFDTMAQQMGPGAQMGAQMGIMNNSPHHSMASALRQQQHHQQQSQFRQQQQPYQPQPYQQQQRMHHRDMPPPQQRQALHNEMMRLSMHGNDDDDPQQQRQRHVGSDANAMTLRPSLVKRGSIAAQELGIAASNTSLMSEFSMFGNSAHNNNINSNNNTNNGGPSIYGNNTLGSVRAHQQHHPDTYNPNPYGQHQSGDMDRRNIFAKMKYARQPSDRMSSRQIGAASGHSIGDGMPDFHMVESQLSLYSNLSGMTGNDSTKNQKVAATATAVAAAAGEDSRKPAAHHDLLGGAGSRHSIMSGLSRISDTSEVHSIFSDLSRKIGNVSTRSIAMSEISGADAYRGGDDSDSTPSFGEAEARVAPSGTMDFDVF
jgi:hypothetical protein